MLQDAFGSSWTESGEFEMRESKIDKVLALVQSNGGWSAVYSAYPGLSDAVSKTESRGGSPQVPCPKSGDGRTKFRLYPDWSMTGGGYHNDVGSMPGGIDVISFMENCSKAEALDKIIGICGGDLTSVSKEYVQSVRALPKGPSEDEIAKRVSKLEKLFNKAIPAAQDDSLHIENYLKSRGLKTDYRTLPFTLGFASELWWGNGASKPVKLCGLLGSMTDVNGERVTIHRTFLDNNGHKANVSQPKMLMPPPRYIGGCSIKIDEPVSNGTDTMIGLCEGIETALAIREATGCPMWSCYSDSLLEMVKIPDHVNVVIIFADKDVSGAGIEKAEALANRLRKEGKIVDVYLPVEDIPSGEKSIDWLDVYVLHGTSSFPFKLPLDMSVNTGVTL